MYDHSHLCYLGHNHKGKLKPLNQHFHDVNHTCKHDLIDLEPLSRFRSNILIFMIFRHSPIDVDLLPFSKWCHDDDK